MAVTTHRLILRVSNVRTSVVVSFPVGRSYFLWRVERERERGEKNRPGRLEFCELSFPLSCYNPVFLPLRPSPPRRSERERSSDFAFRFLLPLPPSLLRKLDLLFLSLLGENHEGRDQAATLPAADKSLDGGAASQRPRVGSQILRNARSEAVIRWRRHPAASPNSRSRQVRRRHPRCLPQPPFHFR